MKPHPVVVETLRNIKTEIGAGKVLFPTTDTEHAYNNACDRAISIIQLYVEGCGLFQLTQGERSRAVMIASVVQPIQATELLAEWERES